MPAKRQISLLKSLNFKIVIYFIAFAYLPLLVFSVLGYYLNKDMITRINLENLRALNLSYTNRINAYLDFNQNLLAKFDNINSYFNGSDFVAVHEIDKDTFQVIFTQDAEKKMEKYKPFIEHDSVTGQMLRGYFSARKLQDLVKNDTHDYQVFLIFYRNKIRISEMSISDLDSTSVFDNVINSADSKARISWHKYDQTAGLFSDFTLLRPHDVIIETQVDVNTFYGELDSFLNKILIANGMLALILLGLALFYSHQITTPVHKLISAVQNIRGGNLDSEIGVSSNDEIQILANEFELMRQRLQESYQRMEEKIDLRTKELQGAQAQILHQEKMASLGLMAAGIAHEIGNPLTSISSMAQIIKRKSDDEKTLEYVSNILKNIERISRIVRELVDFSKPVTHKAAPADINDIITSAVGIIKYDRRSKNIKFALNLDEKLPKISVVADHLMQVFLNILINAVDANEGQGEEIVVSSYTQKGSIFIAFKDQGCGIPKENLNKIFEPFYTTKEVGKGTGLGLTVSYGLIKKLGGEIKVSSALNQGSTFTIVLPENSRRSV